MLSKLSYGTGRPPSRASGAASLGLMLILALPWSVSASASPIQGPEYRAALRACHFWKGHRPDRRRGSTYDPYIARCLKRRGWMQDGLPQNLLDGGPSRRSTSGMP